MGTKSRLFTEAISLKNEAMNVDLNSNVTGVLTERGHLETDTSTGRTWHADEGREQGDVS